MPTFGGARPKTQTNRDKVLHEAEIHHNLQRPSPRQTSTGLLMHSGGEMLDLSQPQVASPPREVSTPVAAPGTVLSYPQTRPPGRNLQVNLPDEIDIAIRQRVRIYVASHPGISLMEEQAYYQALRGKIAEVRAKRAQEISKSPENKPLHGRRPHGKHVSFKDLPELLEDIPDFGTATSRAMGDIDVLPEKKDVHFTKLEPTTRQTEWTKFPPSQSPSSQQPPPPRRVPTVVTPEHKRNDDPNSSIITSRKSMSGGQLIEVKTQPEIRSNTPKSQTPPQKANIAKYSSPVTRPQTSPAGALRRDNVILQTDDDAFGYSTNRNPLPAPTATNVVPVHSSLRKPPPPSNPSSDSTPKKSLVWEHLEGQKPNTNRSRTQLPPSPDKNLGAAGSGQPVGQPSGQGSAKRYDVAPRSQAMGQQSTAVKEKEKSNVWAHLSSQQTQPAGKNTMPQGAQYTQARSGSFSAGTPHRPALQMTSQSAPSQIAQRPMRQEQEQASAKQQRSEQQRDQKQQTPLKQHAADTQHNTQYIGTFFPFVKTSPSSRQPMPSHKSTPSTEHSPFPGNPRPRDTPPRSSPTESAKRMSPLNAAISPKEFNLQPMDTTNLNIPPIDVDNFSLPPIDSTSTDTGLKLPSIHQFLKPIDIAISHSDATKPPPVVPPVSTTAQPPGFNTAPMDSTFSPADFTEYSLSPIDAAIQRIDLTTSSPRDETGFSSPARHDQEVQGAGYISPESLPFRQQLAREEEFAMAKRARESKELQVHENPPSAGLMSPADSSLQRSEAPVPPQDSTAHVPHPSTKAQFPMSDTPSPLHDLSTSPLAVPVSQNDAPAQQNDNSATQGGPSQGYVALDELPTESYTPGMVSMGYSDSDDDSPNDVPITQTFNDAPALQNDNSATQGGPSQGYVALDELPTSDTPGMVSMGYSDSDDDSPQDKSLDPEPDSSAVATTGGGSRVDAGKESAASEEQASQGTSNKEHASHTTESYVTADVAVSHHKMKSLLDSVASSMDSGKGSSAASLDSVMSSSASGDSKMSSEKSSAASSDSEKDPAACHDPEQKTAEQPKANVGPKQSQPKHKK
jgi:hypothetical protein